MELHVAATQIATAGPWLLIFHWCIFISAWYRSTRLWIYVHFASFEFSFTLSVVASAKHLGAPWIWSVCWGEYPLSGAGQTDLFLNTDLYLYTECNNTGKQLRPLNTLCWPSAEGHPGKLSEQTQLISGRCLWINRISWLFTSCDFIFWGGGAEIWIAAKVWNQVTTLESESKRPTGFGLVTYFTCNSLMCPLMTRSLLIIMCKLSFHHYFPPRLRPFHYLFRRRTVGKRTFLFFKVAPWFSLRQASTLEMIQQFKRGKLCLFALVPNPPQPYF